MTDADIVKIFVTEGDQSSTAALAEIDTAKAVRKLNVLEAGPYFESPARLMRHSSSGHFFS